VLRAGDEGGFPGAQHAVPPRLVVPAYFHPAAHPDQWEWLAEHPSRVRLVILNVANGPGAGPEPPFQAAVERLRGAGVHVIGYVDTNYSRRPVQYVTSSFRRYVKWYDVTGVCLDRAAAGAAEVDYYAGLAARVREMGARTVFFNHGIHPQEAYAEHADLLGTFEGPWPAYQQADVPRWTRRWPAEKFYHVVYSVPPERFDDAARLASQRHAASVYITERGGSNPYDRLPAEGWK
jgi:hypothetical protein